MRRKQQKHRNTVGSEDRHSPEDAYHCEGLKTWWELPSATLQLKQATKQHPAQFKLLPLAPLPHTLSLFHTVEPVSFPAPHSSSSTVIEPRTGLAFSCRLPQRSEPPYDCAALREEAGSRLRTVKRRREEVGKRKWEQVKRSKWGRKKTTSCVVFDTLEHF